MAIKLNYKYTPKIQDVKLHRLGYRAYIIPMISVLFPILCIFIPSMGIKSTILNQVYSQTDNASMYISSNNKTNDVHINIANNKITPTLIPTVVIDIKNIEEGKAALNFCESLLTKSSVKDIFKVNIDSIKIQLIESNKCKYYIATDTAKVEFDFQVDPLRSRTKKKYLEEIDAQPQYVQEISIPNTYKTYWIVNLNQLHVLLDNQLIVISMNSNFDGSQSLSLSKSIATQIIAKL